MFNAAVKSRSRRNHRGLSNSRNHLAQRNVYHRRLLLEMLEDRRLLSVGAEEQLFVYLLNRTRHDPVAYQQEQNLPVDLSYVTPRGPLAVNDKLFASSEFHAQEMATYNYFAHQSQVTGDWPNKMVRDQGYPLPSYFPNDRNSVESLVAGGSRATAPDALKVLIIDEGINPPGHRNHLLGISEFHSENREIGVGYAYSSSSYYRNYWAIHATRASIDDRFITGVVYDDLNGNRRYDLNEGLSGISVICNGMSTTTNAAGGWTLKVSPSTYYVTASGSGFSGTATATASVGNENVEVDFISGQNLGVVNFNDVQPLPSLSINDVSLTEGNSGTKSFTFTVSMSGTNTQGASVSYATANGTATSSSDYVAANGTLTWAAGDTSAKTISVTVNGDTSVEPNEAFYVHLSSPNNATLSDNQGVGTIQNDDSLPLPSLAINNVTQTEGNAGTKTFSFTVSMSGTNTQGASVSYATVNGTATSSSDYVAANGTLTWAAGDTSAKTISVTVNGDTTVEADETFYVNLSSPSNATVSDNQGMGTIQNDDISLAIAATDATKAEGNSGTTPFTFTVSRTGLTTGTTTVNYAVTASGTNPANTADFGGTLPSGQVSFAAGETSKVLSINVSGDLVVEPDEGFMVTLSGASGNAQITTPTMTGTIQNDDVALPALSINNVTLSEGDSGTKSFTFTVSMSGTNSQGASVSYATANGTATAGSDYVATSGTLTWVAGDVSSKTISITVNGDTTVEPDETFYVNLSNHGGASVAKGQGVGVIQNDDIGPTISSVLVVEQAGPRNGTLTTSESLLMTFNAEDADGVASTTVQVDGQNVTPVYGPYAAASGVNFGVPLGMLSAGAHNYSIVATDNVGNPTSPAYTGTFDVLPTTGPTISHVVVAEAGTAKNGTLESSDKLVITWSATSDDGIASKSLTVDGRTVSTIYGPYGVNYAGVFGPLAAGVHDYTIEATDFNGVRSEYSGTFNVLPTTGPTISHVVVAEARMGSDLDGIKETSDKLVITWSATSDDGNSSRVWRRPQSLTVDGQNVTAIYGPYGVNYAGVFGPLAAGVHDYTIKVTDANGIASTHSGTFNVIAAASVAPRIGNVVVAETANLARDGLLNTEETLVLTWTLTDADGIASKSLAVDGNTVATIYGPYGNAYAGLLGQLPQGTHVYQIQATDTTGQTSTLTGTFSVAAALTLETSTAPAGSAAVLTDAELASITAEAAHRLEAVLGSRVSTALSGVSIQVADLPGNLLGATTDGTILIDRDAAGYGWFVDPTPGDDEEFILDDLGSLVARQNTAADGRADLLTTVMHEFGHTLGYDHADEGLMDDLLPLGTRRTDATDEVFAGYGE